ncbi:uncharacterized protein KGF55_004075 [Candida pseudojiufengensis]|uniref:uncharacterized protein n=1 Tax=Candida pseudojiufengensis TaxID=497109 RepID=UPI002224B2AF|nr:uncharacterized protein KGF55_004075 [Candida pseudojiufengensis]KAI5961452.1 hypothetical protein KGF55_004075 [Candida pseudojiufengensis]
MNYQDAYIQDKKRKLSQEMDQDSIKETILNVEQQEDIDHLMHDQNVDINNIAKHAKEIDTNTIDELTRQNRALIIIEEFLQNENNELKKSYKDLEKENLALKKVLKNDFQSNYKYIHKSYM